MAHQVIWTAAVEKEFIERANLNPYQIKLLRSRIHGDTIIQQAEMFHRSTATISRQIAQLKLLYDAVQRESDTLPPRKFSAKELYQDTH